LVHHYELSQAKKTRYNKRIGFIMMNKQWFVHMNYTMTCETCQRFSEEDVNVTVKQLVKVNHRDERSMLHFPS